MPVAETLLTWPSNRQLWLALVVLLVLVRLVGRNASAADLELKPNSGYDRPILAFELAAERAPDIFKTWDRDVKRRLREALLWDYLFLCIYPLAISVSCLLAGRFLAKANWLSFRYCLLVVGLQWIAAALDAIENFALLNVLKGYLAGGWPLTARWCATAKFSLVAIGLIYSLALGGIGWGIKSIASREK